MYYTIFFIKKNVSKTYLNAFFEVKLPKNCNQEKTHNPFNYAGLQAYLPQQTLYLRPLPQGHKELRPIFSTFLGVAFLVLLSSFTA